MHTKRKWCLAILAVLAQATGVSAEEERFVQDRFAIIHWIERPPVAPAHMERSFRAIEVGSYIMLLGAIVSKAAMLPRRGKRFELKIRHLRIGRVGVVAANGTTTR